MKSDDYENGPATSVQCWAELWVMFHLEKLKTSFPMEVAREWELEWWRGCSQRAWELQKEPEEQRDGVIDGHKEAGAGGGQVPRAGVEGWFQQQKLCIADM